jgi:adenosylcobinamide-phosphate synthase
MSAETLLFIPIPVAAFVLDMLFGDPHGLPHPVRWIGTAINHLETSCRRMDAYILPEISGGFAVLTLTTVVAWIADFLTSLEPGGIIIAVYLAYAGLALQGLVREARNVLQLLQQDEIDQARTALSMLVSRDTSQMDAEAIRRSLAETVCENFSDGFVAPFFYLMMLGIPGMWAYKTVNTFDSMWGYRTERFARLGMIAARTDDILNWIPARLSWLLLCVTGWAMRLNAGTAMSKTPAQARTMESPNAGWPMAACAWLLQGSMGGAVTYFGTVKQKPRLGPENGLWSNGRLNTLLRLAIRTGWLTAALGGIIWLI